MDNETRTPRRAVTLSLLGLLAAAVLVAVTPTASAHPVVVRCTGGPVQQAAGAYVAQFDPTNPNTWFSGILYVNPPLACVTDCEWGGRCYPMPCFYDPAYPPNCDAAHPIEVPWPV